MCVFCKIKNAHKKRKSLTSSGEGMEVTCMWSWNEMYEINFISFINFMTGKIRFVLGRKMSKQCF